MTDSNKTQSAETILAAIREVQTDAPGGAEALFTAAMLADAPLPYDFVLVSEGTQHNPSLINPAAAFFAATATVDPLINHDLISVDANGQAFSLHAHVRKILLDSMSNEEKKEWADRAIYGLNMVLPDAEPQNWPTVEWLMPHVHACSELITAFDANSPAANRVLHQTGFSLYHQNRHREAANFLDLALAVDVAIKGKYHPDICSDLEGLGTVLWAAEDYARAEKAFTSCLELQKQIMTEDNQATGPVLNSLAVVRQSQGKLQEAEETFKECLRVLQICHGEAHPAVASCLSNMALLYESLNNPEKALELAQRSLAINRSFFGDMHPDVAADLNTLALLHDSLNNTEEAEKFFRESLALREHIFGKNHPETAQALCNLALLLDSADQVDEAMTLYEQGLSAYEASLGPNHPLMESALDNYIVLLEKTGTRPASDTLRKRTEATLRTIVERSQ